MRNNRTAPANPARPGAAHRQVFSDPNQRRGAWFRWLFIAVVLIVLMWIVAFFGNIGSLKFVQSGAIAYPADARIAAVGAPPQGGLGGPISVETRAFTQPLRMQEESSLDCAKKDDTPISASSGTGSGKAFRVFAFLPNTPDWTYLSLNRACGLIDVLMPEWFSVSDETGGLKSEKLDGAADEEIHEYRATRGASLVIYPTVTLQASADGTGIRNRLRERKFRVALAREIERAIVETETQGICVDPGGGWGDGDAALLTAFLQDLRGVLSGSGSATCLIAQAGRDYWRRPAVVDAVDHVVLKVFDEPWIGSPQKPLAPEDWFAATADEALNLVGRDKLVIALGAFAIDWISGRPMPEKIAYAEAMSRISQAGDRIDLESSSGNSFSSLVDGNGQRHEIWLLDAVSANNQLLALGRLGALNIAVSDLGYEDPGLWNVLDPGTATQQDIARALRDISVDDYVSYSGEGPFMKVTSASVHGIRSLAFDGATNRITGQSYVRIPDPVSIRRYGRAPANQIVLSFDDGPDPEYTRQILDTLAAENVPATFFVVGNNALQSQDLIRRMVDEGHEIGSHTFLHPRMDQISNYRTIVEINSVQKLIAGITGRAIRLYREPFLRSSGPVTARQAEPLRVLQSAGYVIAGSDIVPQDWKDTPADGIVSHVMEQVQDGAVNVIVLHDAGSDRSETVAAIPKLIRALRAQGYEFISMAEALGTTRDALMPKVAGSRVALDNVSFNALAAFRDSWVYLFWLAIIIGAGRSVAMLILALLRRPRRPGSNPVPPSVTVVIPAFNEAIVIRKCIDQVLESNYPNLQVIVVDDGSRDDTHGVVQRRFGGHPRVRIMTQHNQGKWRALNAAYRSIDTEIAVCIDADTQIDPNAIAMLVRQFSDPDVGAVAGKIVVGNRRNLLTMLQALEYVTAQNIERRAAESFNGMLVVPGAIGAWRVSAVRKVGLYSGATLSEDADLTVSLIRAGYRVAYEDRAIAFTEAPARLKSLLTQRLRWSLGMLQVGWKHKGAWAERRAVGLFSLTDLAIFGYVFPLIAPLADLLFFYLLYDFAASYWSSDPAGGSGAPAYFFWGYLALPLMDILTAFTALCFDRKEKFAMLLLFPFQRLFYRQILYFSVFRALLRALTGKLAKWNKADRAGFILLSRAK